jgi:hypothetical protein
MRQLEMASSVARVLRVLLTNHKEKKQRLATQVPETNSNQQHVDSSREHGDDSVPKSPESAKCSVVEAVRSEQQNDDEDDFSLQQTLPEIIQACRSSRLQLIHLAPRLLEESAHTSNSNVRVFSSQSCHVIKSDAGFCLRKCMFACHPRIILTA